MTHCNFCHRLLPDLPQYQEDTEDDHVTECRAFLSHVVDNLTLQLKTAEFERDGCYAGQKRSSEDIRELAKIITLQRKRVAEVEHEHAKTISAQADAVRMATALEKERDEARAELERVKEDCHHAAYLEQPYIVVRAEVDTADTRRTKT